MKRWITAALIGVVLAFAGPRVLEAIHPGSDPWGVLDAAVSASLWALLPSLAIGWAWQRVNSRTGRYLPAFVSATATIVLLIVVVRIVHHRWLWDIGMLILAPFVVCGIPIGFVVLSVGKNRSSYRAEQR